MSLDPGIAPVHTIQPCLILLLWVLWLHTANLSCSECPSSWSPGFSSCFPSRLMSPVYSSFPGSCIQLLSPVLVPVPVYSCCIKLLYTASVWCFCSGFCMQLLPLAPVPVPVYSCCLLCMSWLLYTAPVSCFCSPAPVPVQSYFSHSHVSNSCVLLLYTAHASCWTVYSTYLLLDCIPQRYYCLNIFGSCLVTMPQWLLSTTSSSSLLPKYMSFLEPCSSN